MTPRRIEVLFYGLFMDADLLRAKGVHPLNLRTASVPGFALRIGQHATLSPTAEARAYGVLVRLTHDEIDRLYSDVSVSAYRPEAVVAELSDGTQVAALCFNLVAPPGSDEANSEYATRLRALASRLGLPPGYIQSIR